MSDLSTTVANSGDDDRAVESAESLTPREIVAELDRHIVGQQEAKRAVAVAVRNRWRRRQLDAEMAREVSPKNILMIGPTGVGKTEIARRLARLTGAPFIKVEATKFTEVGYYGRDVESMVRELVENAIGIVRQRERRAVEQEARERSEERLLDLLAPRPVGQGGPFGGGFNPFGQTAAPTPAPTPGGDEHYQRTRQRLREMLRAGELEERTVEVAIEQQRGPMVMGGMGLEQMDVDLQGMFEKLLPRSTTRRELPISQARQVLFDQECEALLDPERINAQAVELTQDLGIIFLDEIDKIVASEGRGADVSRQGVQRDLLPIVEGTAVKTRYGMVHTDHVLFIAAGAFHRTSPAELMPELQGRFPIRVELRDLTKDDFVRILTEPRCSLTRQYAALLGTEGVELEFTPDGIDELAAFAHHVNQTTQNIGARRLYTLLERLLEELSFAATEMGRGRVSINAPYVRERLGEIARDEDLSRYIL